MIRKQSGMSVTSLRGKRRKTAYAGCLYIIKNKSLKGESKTLKYFTLFHCYAIFEKRKNVIIKF